MLRRVDSSLEVLRAGRYVQEWLGDMAWDTPIAALAPDCAMALEQAVNCALHNNRPYLGVAHCVRDGLVQTCDVAALTRIPGIGKKTAERMVVELRDRAADFGSGPTTAAGSAPDPLSEAITALQALGYKPAEAERMARKAASDGDTPESIIRKALQQALR